MRVAPVALYYKNQKNILETALTGAKVCALTHGHPLGYMSGAALVYVINRIVYGGCQKIPCPMKKSAFSRTRLGRRGNLGHYPLLQPEISK